MDLYIPIVVIITNLITIILMLMAKLNTLIKLEIIHLLVQIMEDFLIINKMDPNPIKIKIILIIKDIVMLL